MHVDDAEEQVYEYLDRSLQYRIEMSEAHGLTTRKFSHIYVKYMFFKGPSVQTPACLIRDGVAPLQERSRHVVVVNDTFVKYLAGSSLTIEVRLGSTKTPRSASNPLLWCCLFIDIRQSGQRCRGSKQVNYGWLIQ